MTFLESIIYMAWRGLAIGLIISAPMGPVGMLCIQRTLDKGRHAGLYTGIGAAISDLFYSLVTGFGLSFIEDFLERNQNIIQLVGSCVLIGFGIYLFRNNPSKRLKKPVDENVSMKKSILTGFLFTVSNPLILFLIIGLFARFNFILPAGPGGGWLLHLIQYVTGFVFLFLGALLWWWFITFSVDKVRSHFNIRSMWLINKIIGSIILLFAVVGIFTAVSALASAQGITCWNASRGYGPFEGERNGSGNILANPTSDTLYLLAPCGSADAVELRLKARNLKTRKDWGLALTGRAEGRKVRILVDIRAREGASDGISTSPVLELESRIVTPDGSPAPPPARKSFADNSGLLRRVTKGMSGPDPTGALNFFKLVAYDGSLTLFGGLHTPERLLQAPLPEGFAPDSIGLFLTPGARVAPDELRLTVAEPASDPAVWEDPELLEEYLAVSRDWLEGYWQTLDRSLDEALLRLGGDYRLAMVRALDGYDLIYLSGAKVNADGWRRGMVKASLRPSGIKDVWNVTWFDAMHSPLSHELKGQIDQSGTLTLQFPYQSSQLRLHKGERQQPAGGVTPAAASGR